MNRTLTAVLATILGAAPLGCAPDDGGVEVSAPGAEFTTWGRIVNAAETQPVDRPLNLDDGLRTLRQRYTGPPSPPRPVPPLEELDEVERLVHDLVFDIGCAYMALADGSPFILSGPVVEGRSLNALDVEQRAELDRLLSAISNTRRLINRLPLPRGALYGVDVVIPRDRCPDAPLPVEGGDLDDPVDARLTRAVTQLACAHDVVDPARPRVQVVVRAIRREERLAAVTNYAVRTLPDGRRIESSRNGTTTFGRVLTSGIDERDSAGQSNDPSLPMEVIRRAIYPSVDDCAWAETGGPIPAEVAERHCALHPESASCQRGPLSP